MSRRAAGYVGRKYAIELTDSPLYTEQCGLVLVERHTVRDFFHVLIGVSARPRLENFVQYTVVPSRSLPHRPNTQLFLLYRQRVVAPSQVGDQTSRVHMLASLATRPSLHGSSFAHGLPLEYVWHGHIREHIYIVWRELCELFVPVAK